MTKTDIEIIVVEDNPNDAELMVRSLRSGHMSNKIQVIDDGEKAMDFFFNDMLKRIGDTALPPKVIILDLKLPKVSGLNILKKLKEHQVLSKIPVVVVTSSNQDPDIKSAYEYGANSYVVKPVDFIKFFETVNKLGYYWMKVNQQSSM